MSNQEEGLEPPRTHELSRRLASAEAGVSGIPPGHSWFSDRCAEPLGHDRLMLDLPRRGVGPLGYAQGFRSGLVVLREILTDASNGPIRFPHPERRFSPAGSPT